LISEVDIRDWGNTPTRPIESKEQYEHYLRTHDWFYEWSDDHSVWLRGWRAVAYLKEAAPLFDPDLSVWRKYANG